MMKINDNGQSGAVAFDPGRTRPKGTRIEPNLHFRTDLNPAEVGDAIFVIYAAVVRHRPKLGPCLRLY